MGEHSLSEPWLFAVKPQQADFQPVRVKWCFLKGVVNRGMSSNGIIPIEGNVESVFWSRCRKELTGQAWLLSFERPVYKVGPRLVSGDLDFWRVPTTLIKVAYYAYNVYKNNMVHAEHLLSFWENGIWGHARQKVPMWSVPNKNPGHWVSNEPPSLVTFHKLSQLIARGIKHILCDSNEKGLLEAYAWFPQTLLHVPFPFADCTWYPFTLGYHSYEYNHRLSPVKPPVKYLAWGSWDLLTQSSNPTFGNLLYPHKILYTQDYSL